MPTPRHQWLLIAVYRQLGAAAMPPLYNGFNDAVYGRSALPDVSRCSTHYLHKPLLRDGDMVQSAGKLEVR